MASLKRPFTTYVNYLQLKTFELANEGDTRLRAGDIEGALDFYAKAIRTAPATDPVRDNLHTRRARAYLWVGRYYDVITECNASIGMGNVVALLSRADAYRKIQMLREALDDFHKMMEIMPNNPSMPYILQSIQQITQSVHSKDESQDTRWVVENKTTIHNLPLECLERIMSFLPIVSLVRATEVCKLWQVISQRPHLWFKLLIDRWDERSLRFVETKIAKYPLSPTWAGCRLVYANRHRLWRRPAVVIDCGSGYGRVGFAGERRARAIFSMAAGVCEDGDGYKWVPDIWSLESGRVTAMDFPVVYGLHNNIDCLTVIYQYIFNEILHIDPTEHAVLISFCPWQCPAFEDSSYERNRSAILSVMFERLHVAAVSIIHGSSLALFASGLTEGLVLDIGFSATRVIPTIKNSIIRSAVQSCRLGGSSVTSAIMCMLGSRGFRLAGLDQLMSMKTLKEENFYISEDITRENPVSVPYKMNGEVDVTLSDERYMAPEILFQPDLVMASYQYHNASGEPPGSRGVHQLISSCVSHFDVETQQMLLQNVVVTGGSAAFPGFVPRLEKTLGCKVHPPMYGDVADSVWLGGSIIASSSTFLDRHCYLRSEFAEQGLNILSKDIGLPVPTYSLPGTGLLPPPGAGWPERVMSL